MEIAIKRGCKVVLVTAYAQGYYSQAEAYDEMFLPLEVYDKYKSQLENLDLGAYELDGKHSYTECDKEILIDNVENLIKTKFEDNQDFIIDNFIEEIKRVEEDFDKIEKLKENIVGFNELLQSYKSIQQPKSITLTKDCIIEGKLITKGTKISWQTQFELPAEITIKDDWCI